MDNYNEDNTSSVKEPVSRVILLYINEDKRINSKTQEYSKKVERNLRNYLYRPVKDCSEARNQLSATERAKNPGIEYILITNEALAAIKARLEGVKTLYLFDSDSAHKHQADDQTIYLNFNSPDFESTLTSVLENMLRYNSGKNPVARPDTTPFSESKVDQYVKNVSKIPKKNSDSDTTILDPFDVLRENIAKLNKSTEKLQEKIKSKI